MVDFYGDGAFSHGCSVDHVIFDFVSDDEASLLPVIDMKTIERFEITSSNAEAFERKQAPEQPLYTAWCNSGLVPIIHGTAALRLKRWVMII